MINKYIQELDAKMSGNATKKQWEIHAKRMMEVFIDKQAIFIELWRKNFVKTLNPRYLPDTWSVTTPKN